MELMMFSSMNQKGQSLVEFTLLSPLLIMLVLCGFELSRILKHYQVATALSNEIASNAFRDCSTPFNVNNLSNLQTCLDTIIQEVASPAGGVLQNVELLTSIWQWDPVTTLPNRLGTATNSPTMQSKIDSGSGTITPAAAGILLPLCQTNQIIAIAEVRMAYEPIVPIIAGITSFIIQREIYVPTIY